jgi:sarcosine oxidase subunit gamma
MSDAVSALMGATFDGTARIAEAGPRGMVTLRGDLADKKFAKAVKDAVGLGVPGQGEALVEGEKGVLWMSPDELLLMMPYAEAPAVAAAIAEALAGTHHLAANVSDARAVFTVSGPGAREVIAKLTPADLHPASFGPGRVRRTRMAQIAAAVWMTSEEAIEIVCFRSVAQYLFDVLKTGAQRGAGVGYF